jgi:ribonuclease P protein component
LRKRREFLSVQRRGQRVHGQLQVVIAAASRTPGPRLGVTASKKVGNAVQRNRTKRLIRDAFRHLRTDVPSWLEIVVVARKSMVDSSQQAVLAELQKCIDRAIQEIEQRRKRRARPAPNAPNNS